MVYVGAFEREEACRAWKQEYELPFPVFPDDADNTLFKTYTNGWVPWSVLIAPNGTVVFSENEFDEAGFSRAIEQMYEEPPAPTDELSAQPRPRKGPAEAHDIVILGGGTGGLVAAHHLRRRLARTHRIVVIDRSADHVYQPSMLWQIIGERRLEQFHRPLSRLRKKGIAFRNEEVSRIDVDRRVVETISETLAYDYLIVALGATLAPETVEGID